MISLQSIVHTGGAWQSVEVLVWNNREAFSGHCSLEVPKFLLGILKPHF